MARQPREAQAHMPKVTPESGDKTESAFSPWFSENLDKLLGPPRIGAGPPSDFKYYLDAELGGFTLPRIACYPRAVALPSEGRRSVEKSDVYARRCGQNRDSPRACDGDLFGRQAIGARQTHLPL